MTRTTRIWNVTITQILDGDHGEVYDQGKLRAIEAEMKANTQNIDNVNISFIKTFVTEERE